MLIVFISTDYMLKYANFTELLQQLAFDNQHYTAFIRLYFGWASLANCLYPRNNYYPRRLLFYGFLVL